MQLIIFLVIAYFGWLLVWSLVSFAKLQGQSGQLAALQARVRDLELELSSLRSKLQSNVSQVAKTPALPDAGEASRVTPVTTSSIQPPPVGETSAAVPPAPVPPVPPPAFAPEPAHQPPPLPVAASSLAAAPAPVASAPLSPEPASPLTDAFPPLAAGAMTEIGEGTAGLPPAQLPQSVSHAESVTDSAPTSAPWINWELFMGVRLFAWLGGLAAFFGIALFLKLSFENNWFPPELRVALGFLVGVGALGTGLWFSSRTYTVLSQTLCATGVVILYGVTFTCHAIYRFPFFDQLPTFALMFLITAVAFTLAVRMSAQVIALLGLLGGFLTPVLVSSGHDNALGLFSYVALLDAGILAIILYRNWNYIAALAALGTLLLQLAWSFEYFTVQKMPAVHGALLGIGSLFLVALWFSRRRSASENHWLYVSLAGFGLYILGYAYALLQYRALCTEPASLFLLLLGGDLLLLALVVLAPSLQRVQEIAGLLVFLWLGAWLARWLSPELSWWAFGSCFLFALLHSAFPLVLSRLRPGVCLYGITQYFIPFALLLLLIPIFKLPAFSLGLWIVFFLLDLVALAFAALAGALCACLLALLVTVIGIACFVLRGGIFHHSHHGLEAAASFGASQGSTLLLTALFSLLFIGGAYWLVRRFSAGKLNLGDAHPLEAHLLPLMPVIPAVLPFLLLILITLSLNPAQPDAIFGLALVFSLLLTGLASLLREQRLPFIALLALSALQWAWFNTGITDQNAAGSFAWFTGFYVFFLLQPFFGLGKRGDFLWPWLASAFAGPLQCLLVYRLVQSQWPNDVMGLVPFAFALPSLAVFFVVLRRIQAEAAHRLDILALFGGVALLFISAIIPVQFERQWITVGFAVEGVALLWLFRRVPHEGLRITAFGLFCAAFIRLTFNTGILHYQLRSDLPILNWYLYSFGLVIACCLLGARQLRTLGEQICGLPAARILQAFAVILSFLLLNIEISDFFLEPGARLTQIFFLHGNFARDMCYTVGWSLFSLALLVLGLWAKRRAARRTAIVILAVTLLKLFFNDLSSLGQIYRVVAFIVVALITFLVSFLYQRFLTGISASDSAEDKSAPQAKDAK